MKKLDHWIDRFAGALFGIMILSLLWDDFPTRIAVSAVMAALYIGLAFFSMFLGVGCLRSDACWALWDRRGVPPEVQARFARMQGVLFLVNAAIGPVGLLVHCFVDFDSDFLLLAQMIGLPAVGLLGLLPRGTKTAHG